MNTYETYVTGVTGRQLTIQAENQKAAEIEALREDTISQLESEVICNALYDFILAMREDADSINDEIRQGVLKELDRVVKSRAFFEYLLL